MVQCLPEKLYLTLHLLYPVQPYPLEPLNHSKQVNIEK